MKFLGLPRRDSGCLATLAALACLFFEWSFWVVFLRKMGPFAVSSWTQRGEIVVEMWCFDGDKSTLKNTPTF
jgi:hypothetical protein